MIYIPTFKWALFFVVYNFQYHFIFWALTRTTINWTGQWKSRGEIGMPNWQSHFKKQLLLSVCTLLFHIYYWKAKSCDKLKFAHSEWAEFMGFCDRSSSKCRKNWSIRDLFILSFCVSFKKPIGDLKVYTHTSDICADLGQFRSIFSLLITVKMTKEKCGSKQKCL